MIRRIDTGGVIDGIGMAETTQLTEFNSGMLRHSQIAPLANNSAVQLRRVHSQIVIGAITHRLMALERCFHVSADAAVEQKVYRTFQHFVDKLLRT